MSGFASADADLVLGFQHALHQMYCTTMGMFPFTILHTLRLTGVTRDKVVLITGQQLLSGQHVLLHPHILSNSSLIEQMLLITKHKHDVPKPFDSILIIAHRYCTCCVVTCTISVKRQSSPHAQRWWRLGSQSLDLLCTLGLLSSLQLNLCLLRFELQPVLVGSSLSSCL